MQHPKKPSERKGTGLGEGDYNVVGSIGETRERRRPFAAFGGHPPSLHTNIHLGRAVRVTDAAREAKQGGRVDDQLCSAPETKYRYPIINPVPIHKTVNNSSLNYYIILI